MAVKLILFDLDGTLVRAHGAGLAAMAEAGVELLGPRFSLDGIDPGGQLDPHIFRDAARASGIVLRAKDHEAFRARYLEVLLGHAREGRVRADALPGVHGLLDALGEVDVELGLLTGNYREAAHLKLEAAGISPDLFPVDAFGDEADERAALVPVALERHHARSGVHLRPEEVLIVGDTPRDVDCAQKNGCAMLGVATGRFNRSALVGAGASHVVENLLDPLDVLGYLEGS